MILEKFIENNLKNYSECRNNPLVGCVSGLSKYLNLGFISAQRVVLEVINANCTRENKEAFLEEIIVRKELADNF